MKRVAGLDGVRGLAILWVLLYHCYALVPKAPGWATIPGLLGLANVGWIGVSLFFTLSGYLIIPMLAEQKGTPHFFARFWCRRGFRLVPLYVVLLVSFAIAAKLWPGAGAERARLFGTSIPIWSYGVFVQNIEMAAQGFFGNEWLRPTWSLAVEMQFYALIALVIYFLPRAALTRWLMVLSAASVGFRYGVTLLNPDSPMSLVVLLPSRLDAFLIGGILALASMSTGATASRLRQAIAATVLVGSIAAFWIFATGRFGRATSFVLPLYYLMLAAGSTALLDLAANSSRLVRWLTESRPLVRAGQLSYFLYLFHLPLLWATYRGFFKASPNLESARGAWIMAGVLLLLFASAEISYRYFESPLIRRSHRYFVREGK